MAVLPFTIQLSYAGTPAGTITYNAGTDTITVIGANSTHPAEFLDLYNADVAGGWGQITKQGDKQFLFNCKIYLGNGTSAGTTYFSDIEKQITIANILSTGNFIEGSAYSYLTLGVLDNADAKQTSHGCQFYDLTLANHRIIAHGNIFLYSCDFMSSWYTLIDFNTAGGKMYNCHLSEAMSVEYYATADVYNINKGACAAIDSAHFTYCASPTVSNVQLSGIGRVIYTHSTYNFTVSNLYARNYSTLFYSPSDSYKWNGTCHLINPDVDVWSVTINGTGTVYREYTFDLYVLNGALTDFVEDANVTLAHDGTVYGSWLTNSTGQIDTETLTYGYYNYTGGNTMYGGTPWTLTITHPDWETYTSAFYPYSEIDWSISMQDTSTSNNNMLLVGLLVSSLAFLGLVVIRRKM